MSRAVARPKQTRTPPPTPLTTQQELEEVDKKLSEKSYEMFKIRNDYMKIREELDLMEVFGLDGYSCTEEERENRWFSKNPSAKDKKMIDNYKQYKKLLKDSFYLMQKKFRLENEINSKKPSLSSSSSSPTAVERKELFIEKVFRLMFC